MRTASRTRRRAGTPLPRVGFLMNTRRNQAGNIVPSDGVRDIVTDPPAGFVGNPRAAPTCSPVGVGVMHLDPCPIGGAGRLSVSLTLMANEYRFTASPLPLGNMIARGRRAAAAFAFNITAPILHSRARQRRHKNGSTASAPAGQRRLLQAYGLLGVDFTLWGDPANNVSSMTPSASIPSPTRRGGGSRRTSFAVRS